MPFRGTCAQQFWELDRPSSGLANTLPLGPKALSFDRKGITFCFVLDQSQAQKPDQLSKGKFHTVPCVHERKVNPLYRLAPSNCWWDWRATGSLRCHSDPPLGPSVCFCKGNRTLISQVTVELNDRVKVTVLYNLTPPLSQPTMGRTGWFPMAASGSAIIQGYGDFILSSS